MKNIEKYTNTKDALEAYNKLNSRELFETWLELEYEEPLVPTLLDVAKEVVKTWYAKLPEGSIDRVRQSIVRLSSAIDREKRKPVRNCDKYRAAEEAHVALAEFCGKNKCGSCRCGDSTKTAGCVLEWLYEEAGKDKSHE